MKKSLFGLIVLFVFLTTYTPKFNFNTNSVLNIQKIIIENNLIIESGKIKKKLIFLYDKNLFFLNNKTIQEKLKNEDFIESFSTKKIYPNTLKLMIKEKKPIAILQNKKKKLYISDKGNLINFIDIEAYNDLPVVFGNGREFYSLYKNIQNIKFPLEMIKSFYSFESGRWDLIMHDNKVIKLPIKNYLLSLENFMLSKANSNFNDYKIFDYRIKDQIILN
ncbi:FtsQ-type POTRA domain-containing protein [Pelagibacteraceae bacterium]|nr:FtsQ-type POTRA domain-containing protein [Pelagibacteraceae bacterium]